MDSAGDSLNNTEISAMAALGRMDEALSDPLFEGDGGKDIRLAVLEPELRSGVWRQGEPRRLWLFAARKGDRNPHRCFPLLIHNLKGTAAVPF
jgi:hypothetical protein